MSETKQLLQKIAALRVRLDPPPRPPVDGPPPSDPAEQALRQLQEKVQRGAWHGAALDAATRPLEPDPSTLPARLTARGARVLKKSRELLHGLRALADEPALQGDEQDPLCVLHHEGTAMLDAVLRTVQHFPPTPSAQIRLCEGLEVVLAAVEEHLHVLYAGLEHRRHEQADVDNLADLLCRLANGQPIGLGSLQEQADAIVDGVRAGRPLRILSAGATDAARFAAAHGLTVAQVLARILHADPEWQPRLQTAVMAALVHDVGMTRIPAEILAKPGPLDDDERRLVERHTTISGPLVAPLWPGGGWPVEAVTDHHERLDGTGYPLGRKELQLAAYVRLLAVCDVYAALCAPRPHRPAFDPRTALTDTLLMADHNLLDRVAAERLLVLSFYPPGTVVILDDGSVAAVVGAPPGLVDPTRPIVQMLTGPQGGPLPLPTVVDLLARGDRTIVRSLTRAERRQVLGRKYPELI